MDYLQKYQELRSKTIPGLLLERVKHTPQDVAYRVKKLGIYKERTWFELRRMVASCAMGLITLGLKRGECLALMGDPCEEYVICELAAQTLGAITYGIYPTSSQKELAHLMKDGRACIFIAEHQEYLDRILPLSNQLPHLRHIVAINTKGIFGQDQPSLIPYEKLVENGEREFSSRPEALEEIVHGIRPSDGLFIAYTSGTTGDPKGVLISHGKHLTAAYTFIDRYPVLADFPHRTVVYLPLCSVLGKMVAVTLPLLTSIVPHYGEDIEDLGLTIFETAPTVLFGVPRYFQKFASSIRVGIENSSSLKKLIYRMALYIGQRHIESIWDGRKSLFLSLGYLFGYQAAFRPILNKIGFNKLEIAFSSGAPLPPEVMAFWQIHGVNLSEFYAQTETGGAIICAQRQHFPRPGNVGVPPSGLNIRLSENGEILVHGNDLFDGYWNHPELGDGVLNDKGWLHTGDVGECTPDGSLKLLDRAQDFFITSDGRRFSPIYIENALKSSPYISEAVVFGHNRQYLSCLIEIDFETVSDWASRNNILFTGFTSLVQHPEVIKFIGAEIEKVNKDLTLIEQVKVSRIIPIELNPSEDSGPVTPTRKIKRGLMYEKFKELVESMYNDKQGGLEVFK
jgi:long-chain acyl-CoA synthetase